jgi:hypothetical protein
MSRHSRYEPTLFLPTTAQLKAIADYETGDATIMSERAAQAIGAAKHFVGAIRNIAASAGADPVQ